MLCNLESELPLPLTGTETNNFFILNFERR